MEPTVDLEEINHMSKEEFQKSLKKFIDEQQPQLQSALRKDLIEKFNKTYLGQELNSRIQAKQKIVLSPLVLVLNTLVSEFLYSSDLHYSLSVFTSEVIFPNTLPNFTRSENFRFTAEEMEEIYEAIGLQKQHQVIRSASAIYNEGKPLIYAVLKSLLDLIKERKDSSTKFTQVNPENSDVAEHPKHAQSEVVSELDANIQKVKILNETIENLNGNIKKLAKYFAQLEQSRISTSKSHSLVTEKEEKRYLEVVRSVESISHRLDQCFANFLDLEQKLVEKKESAESLSYANWLRQMRDTPHGQRYIEKFQKSISKLWETEKAKLKQHYEGKFELERKAMKLRFKEDLRQHLNSIRQSSEISEVNKCVIKDIIDAKMQSLETRDESISKKLEKLEEIEQKKENEISRIASKISKIDETLKTVEHATFKESVVLSPLISEDTYRKYEEADNDVENIILTAKTRIKMLEKESELLEKSFSDYLQKQQAKKQTLDADRKRIWRTYQYEKDALKKFPLLTTPNRYSSSEYLNKKPTYNSPETTRPSTLELPRPKKPVFVENPFRSFDTQTYLKSAPVRRSLDRNPGVRDRIGELRIWDRNRIASIEAQRTYQTFDSDFKALDSTPPKPMAFPAPKYNFEPISNGYESIDPPKIVVETVREIQKPIPAKPTPELVDKAIYVDTLQIPPKGLNVSVDKSVSTRSEMDLRDVSLDIELSRSTSPSKTESKLPKPKSPSPLAGKPVEIITEEPKTIESHSESIVIVETKLDFESKLEKESFEKIDSVKEPEVPEKDIDEKSEDDVQAAVAESVNRYLSEMEKDFEKMMDKQDEFEINVLFQNTEAMLSSSSESEKIVISTAAKSDSSEDFWK